MRDYYDDEEWAERVERFADPGGTSALHPAGRGNPRNRSCPTCGAKNVLTPRDVAKRYCCDRCADMAEGGYGS
jgi:ribosomal protein S27AE